VHAVVGPYSYAATAEDPRPTGGRGYLGQDGHLLPRVYMYVRFVGFVDTGPSLFVYNY
jgi:hypothetical protein